MTEWAVIVASGRCEGAEVTRRGVPWRGTHDQAVALVVAMAAQAARFGHDATYELEELNGNLRIA